MIQIPVSEIIQKLVSESGLSESEIASKISKKMESLSGLISEEGAAHIVANEMNIKIFSSGSNVAKLGKIKEGMRNLEVSGRVKQIFPVKEFSSGARHGKVANLLLEDETGSIRVTVWNDMVSKLSDFSIGDVMQIKSSYVRLNNYGFKELHLNERSAIVKNPPGIEIGESKSNKKKISEIDGSESSVEIMAHVVNIFDPRFFEQCPECRKRVILENSGSFSCETHGEVSPIYSYVVNILLDDGTGTIRATFWKDQADSLFGNLDVVYENPQLFDTIKNDVLGTIINISGMVKKNNLSGNLDLNVKKLSKDAQSNSGFLSSQKISEQTSEQSQEQMSEEEFVE